MKAFKKLLLMILMCLLLVPFAGETAYASAGTISLSDPTATVGESVSVTLKATTTDSSTIGSVNMELTYDAKILEFVSGTSATGEAGIIKLSGTADSSIKTYTLTFNALKSGTSSIKISSYDIKDSNSSTIEMSKVGSSTVTISGDGTTNSAEVLESDSTTETDITTEIDSTTETDSTTQDVQTQEQVAQDSLEDKIVSPPKKDVKTEIAGTPFNICKITEDVIPEGFEYIGYMYDGQAVDALIKDNIILFYLNQIGEEPKILYLYDREREGFFKYAPITPSLNYSVVGVDESVVIPEGFTETEVSVGGIAVNSWQSNSNSEYYLLYLMTSEGDKDLYLYDAVEKTVQRYYYTTSEAATLETDSYQTMYTELNANYNKDIQKSTSIIYALIVLAVVLLIIIINLALRLSDKHHPIIEEDDEEEEDQEFEEYQFENEDSVDQDDFEDDYDDYEVDEVVNKKEMKKAAKLAAKLERKEKAMKVKAAKNQKKSSKEELKDELEIDEDDFDDSDDFELEIFDLNDEKK